MQKKRNIKNPKCVIGSDGGQNKCLVTLTVLDENEADDEETLKKYKATGSKRVLIAAKVDDIPENRENIEILINSLNFPALAFDFKVVCDLKLTNLLLGIQSCTASFGCPFGECFKIDPITFKSTNRKGVYIIGEYRTVRNITANHEKWVQETSHMPIQKRRKLLSSYKSCEFPPISFRVGAEDEEVIKILPPDPLHILLGIVNLITDKLEEMYPCEMKEELYPKLCIKKSGEGHGGKFAGPSCKNLLKEESLKLIEEILPTFEITKDFTNYLRSVRHLHEMSVNKDLGDFNPVIDEFEENFFNLFRNYQVSMTLKVHIVVHHYKFYFESTGKTFKETNGEFTETCHHTLRKSDECNGTNIVRKIATPIHQYKSLKSITNHNSKKIGGGETPIFQRVKKTTPSASPLSSPDSSPSYSKKPFNFSNYFKQKYPTAVAEHIAKFK